MEKQKIREGYMPFLEYKTYFRIVGAQYTEKAPLILLHGGPGSTHNYFELLDGLAERTERQLIMYDQLGCGNSYLDGHPELWNMETWTAELKCLISFLGLKHYHLLGQSWGGMLLLNYVCNCDSVGTESIILSSTLPSSEMWGLEQSRMIRELPEKMQEAIKKAQETGCFNEPEYLAAEDEYMRRHAAAPADDQSPECLRRKTKKGRESYLVGWGPNEFTPAGTLKNYDVTEKLRNICQPALVICGGNDLCTPYIAKYMADRIPDSRWELFRDCRHMCFAEDNGHYLDLLTDWLRDKA